MSLLNFPVLTEISDKGMKCFYLSPVISTTCLLSAATFYEHSFEEDLVTICQSIVQTIISTSDNNAVASECLVRESYPYLSGNKF